MASTPPPEYVADASPPGASLNNSGNGKGQPINVLILGETANGKSTLVKHLGFYSGVPNTSIKIGLGNVSCTKEVGSHPISTTLYTSHLTDPSGHPIKNTEYSDLAMFTDDDATLIKDKPDGDGQVFQLNLIDTPGLNDSDGDDLNNMAEIIGRVGELPHLNAILYVRGMDNPYGQSFNVFYDYLCRSMPSIANGLVIVHTNYSVDKVDAALSEGRNLAEERQTSFNKVTKGARNLPHFFIDSLPDTSNPFAMMESLNSCYRLLRLLTVQLPLEVSNLRLLKTPSMLSLDARVILSLERLHSRLDTKLSNDMARVSISKNKAFKLKRQTERLQSRAEDYENELHLLDRDTEIVLGTKTIARDFDVEKLLEGSVRLEKRYASFDADCRISRVSKSTTGGCKWHDEDLRGTSWRATLKSNIFRSMHGTATLYTTSRLKHRRQIETLRSRMKEVQHDLLFLRDQLSDESEALGQDDVQTEALAVNVSKCEALIERMRMATFDASLWPLLRPFYIVSHLPQEHDICEFVMVYDPVVAGLLRAGM